MTGTLPRQLIRPRAHHLETPDSYLSRLCAANSIKHDWLDRKIAQRRRAHADLGIRDQGVALCELGGPSPDRFEKSHAWASVGYENLRGPWDKQAVTRTACLSCTAGAPVTTYPHIRFAFCRRHGQWLGDGSKPQRQGVLDADAWKAERSMRNLVTSGLVSRDLYETAWELTRDNAYLIGEKAWSDRLRRAHDLPGFTREVDDRIALFPVTVRVLQVVARPAFRATIRSGRRDSSQRRAYLYQAFSWLSEEVWVLAEGIDQFFNLDDV